MDLHLMSAAPTDEERAAVDELLGRPDTGWVGGEREAGAERRFARGGRVAREQRDLLLPALHALQARVGWISEGGLTYVCQRLSVPCVISSSKSEDKSAAEVIYVVLRT